MNFITGHIYKPDRLLYFIEPTDLEMENFYKGMVPDSLMAYNGAFGTYDCPGLFIIKTDNGPVNLLGIEFRPDDDRIDYPKNLKSMMLPHSFMITGLDSDDTTFNSTSLLEGVEFIKTILKDHRYYGGITVKKESEIIQFFTLNNSNRILIPGTSSTKEQFFYTHEPDSENEKILTKFAFTDSITGHYNWNYIWPIIAGYGFMGIQDFIFAHFDVKDFNALNIVYGHSVANKVLRTITAKLKTLDWVYYTARCDNDNFVMMIKDMPEEELREKLEKFFQEISRLDVDEHYHIYYRCGVVPMRNTLLLGDVVADSGKHVQRMGNKSYKTEIIFYTDDMQDELRWSSKIKAYLDSAIEKDEFLVYLQPKYNINSEKIHGAEALIRWKYHGRELLNPGKFIPVFENAGLISKLDDIVLQKVCESFIKWKKEGIPLHPVSINLSRKRMGNPDLVNKLIQIVDSYGVDHSLIDFELTESAAYANQNYMISVIKELKENGFKISMDDFGTGYSTLSLLTTMPMDTIKIDKSFVDEIGSPNETERDTTLLKNIIRMAKELRFTCLTEGAETKQQIEKLREFGCEIVQGYYYSKPLPIEEYEKLLKKQ